MTQPPRILTIEDDPAIRRGIVDALRFAGYDVLEAGRGQQGLTMAVERQFDLLLLDLVLPECDGLHILREVRKVRPTLPVIVLTARGDESDRVQGLGDGADDYVVKPFSVKELLARVTAVLRRSPQRPSDVGDFRLPHGVVDLNRHEVRLDDGRSALLSEREVELFRYLAVNSGRVISRDEIMANVWRINPRGISTRTIDMHIVRLREKLGDDPEQPQVLLTVRGQGYMVAKIQ